MQPADHARAAGDAGGLAGEGDEHRLGGVLRQMRIAQAAEVDRINETDAALDEFTETGVVMSGHECIQQFSVIFHRVYLLSAAKAKTAQNFV